MNVSLRHSMPNFLAVGREGIDGLLWFRAYLVLRSSWVNYKFKLMIVSASWKVKPSLLQYELTLAITYFLILSVSSVEHVTKHWPTARVLHQGRQNQR